MVFSTSSVCHWELNIGSYDAQLDTYASALFMLPINRYASEHASVLQLSSWSITSFREAAATWKFGLQG